MSDETTGTDLVVQEAEGVALTPTNKKGWAGLLAKHEARIAPFLPAGVTLERVASTLWVAAESNPDLKQCTPESLVLGTARILSWGLEVGTTAHLLPFKGKATATPDYKGLIQLMREAGARDVDAQVVRDADHFEYELGTAPYVRHKRASTSGKIVAAYCIVWLTSTRFKLEVMTADEIDAVRQEKSRSWKSGALPEWYARKTVIRRAAKYVPRASDKLLAALAVGDADDVLDEPPTPEAA